MTWIQHFEAMGAEYWVKKHPHREAHCLGNKQGRFLTPIFESKRDLEAFLETTDGCENADGEPIRPRDLMDFYETLMADAGGDDPEEFEEIKAALERSK